MPFIHFIPALFTALGVIGLVLVTLSTSIIKGLYLVQRNVTVGKANASLTMGSFGYCITMPNNQTANCSSGFAYTIGNSQAQVNSVYKGFFINGFALVLALIAFFLAFSSGRRFRMYARIFAGVGALLAIIGSGLAFIVSKGQFSMGIGIAIVSLILLVVFAIFSGMGCFVDIKQENAGQTGQTVEADAIADEVQENEDRLMGQFLVDRRKNHIIATRNKELEDQQKAEEAAKKRGCC